MQTTDEAKAHCRHVGKGIEKPAATDGASGESQLQGEKYTDEQLAALHEMYYGPNGICRYSDSLEGWR